jgi:predicted glutamine amidotransferase
MCRFIVAVADAPLAAGELLAAFADMAEASRSPDGDRQGDGWGAAWLDGGGEWQLHRSLAPVWEERAAFARIPCTTALAAHARSASFAEERGDLERSQPFVLGRHVMVFNGLLRGVALPSRRPGLIGAQRLAALLGAFLARSSAHEAVHRLWRLVANRSASLPAVNLAITDGRGIAVLSHREAPPEYYTPHVARHAGAVLLCSQPLPGLAWEALPAQAITVLSMR